MLKKEIEAKYYIFLFSIINFLLFERNYFLHVLELNGTHPIFGILVYSILGFSIVHIVNLIFLSSKKCVKFFTVFLFLVNASTLYFMNTYKIEIDTSMMSNLFETNLTEATEFINFKLFFYIFGFGFIPSLFFCLYFKIKYNKEQYISILKQFFVILITIILVIFLIRSVLKQRNNKRNLYYIIPINYINSSLNVIKTKIKNSLYKPNIEKMTEGLEAENLDFNDKKNLIVFIVGESARSHNFSLNGYERDTNKFLKNYDIISFKNVNSCGTITSYSVPCIFSQFKREDFSMEKSKKYGNIFDIFKALDFDIYWKSNNGDCKSLCSRINSSIILDDTKQYKDGLFIDYFNDKINKLDKKNNFLILHTKGSHGPLYTNKYPNEFEIFKPVCSNADINKCDYKELLNAYDNSIYYTSYFLSQIIDILEKNNDKFNSVLFYVSDHGESLGEDGHFMHGKPYNEASDYQKRVPFFIWMSEHFEDYLKINKQCLKEKVDLNLSHDYIFHSLLGLFKIKTYLYDENLDIFNGCGL